MCARVVQRVYLCAHVLYVRVFVCVPVCLSCVCVRMHVCLCARVFLCVSVRVLLLARISVCVCLCVSVSHCLCFTQYSISMLICFSQFHVIAKCINFHVSKSFCLTLWLWPRGDDIHMLETHICLQLCLHK